LNSTEQSLVERFRRGDDEAFDELYKLLGKRIYRFALRMTGSKEDAEDVAVQTFAEAYRSRQRFSENSALTTWMYRIAVHMAHRQFRRRKPTISLTVEIADTTSERHMARIELVELVLFLPESLRTPFLLVKLEGLTYVEAAEVLGKRPGTVQAQVHEAGKRIRARLTPPGPKAAELKLAEGQP
jgi:RNA polymerase sigma-70 factor, ECF subfamily